MPLGQKPDTDELVKREGARKYGESMNGKTEETKYDRAMREIDDAIRTEDWFSGFANSVTYLEFFAYWLLRWHCIKKKINVKNKLKGLKISTMTLILYMLELIDTNTFTKINTIVKERNKLVHPANTGISYRDRKEKDKAIKMLNDAKYCITKLKEGIGKKKES